MFAEFFFSLRTVKKMALMQETSYIIVFIELTTYMCMIMFSYKTLIYP